MRLDAIIIWLVIAWVLSVMVWPVFFIQMQMSIKHGAWLTWLFMVGVYTAMIFVAYTVYRWLSRIVQSPEHIGIMWMIVGLILLFTGLMMFFEKGNVVDTLHIKFHKSISRLYIYLKWLSLIIINPFIWGFWVALVSAYLVLPIEQTFFPVTVGAMFLGIIILDGIKIFTAKKIKKLINDNRIKTIHRYIWVCIVLFSILIIYNARTCYSQPLSCDDLLQWPVDEIIEFYGDIQNNSWQNVDNM